MMTPMQNRESRGGAVYFYIVVLVVLLSIVGYVVNELISVPGKLYRFHRASLPCEMTVSMQAGVEYMVFYERRSVVDGQAVYGDLSRSQLRVDVFDSKSRKITIAQETDAVPYDRDDLSGEAMYAFVPSATGDYSIHARAKNYSGNSPGVVAVGRYPLSPRRLVLLLTIAVIVGGGALTCTIGLLKHFLRTGSRRNDVHGDEVDLR